MEYALGNKTAVKLLRELLKEPLQKLKEVELVKKAKTGKGSANKIINKLVDKKILTEERIGKTKIIYLNMKNESVFLLKNLFDREKIASLEYSKLAAVELFKDRVRENIKLLVVFGSTIAGTSTKKSDIDILLVGEDIETINREKKNIEELFGEQFNLHIYKNLEIIDKIKKDSFIQNAFLNGVLIYGYDLGRILFLSLKGEESLDRLFFLDERIKSALRNYQNRDYQTAKEILEKTLEQLIFYLLSQKRINYMSKQQAKKAIKKLKEGKIIQKINKSLLKEKIFLVEKLILTTIKNKILAI